MSFKSVLKSSGAALAKQAQKVEANYVRELERRENHIQRFEDRYANLDRDDLIRRYQNTTGDSKIAAGRLLKKQSSGRD